MQACNIIVHRDRRDADGSSIVLFRAAVGTVACFCSEALHSRRDRKPYLHARGFRSDNRKCQDNGTYFSLEGKVLIFNKLAQEMTGYAGKMVRMQHRRDTAPGRDTELGRIIRKPRRDDRTQKEISFTAKNGRKIYPSGT